MARALESNWYWIHHYSSSWISWEGLLLKKKLKIKLSPLQEQHMIACNKRPYAFLVRCRAWINWMNQHFYQAENGWKFSLLLMLLEYIRLLMLLECTNLCFVTLKKYAISKSIGVFCRVRLFLLLLLLLFGFLQSISYYVSIFLYDLEEILLACNIHYSRLIDQLSFSIRI